MSVSEFFGRENVSSFRGSAFRIEVLRSLLGVSAVEMADLPFGFQSEIKFPVSELIRLLKCRPLLTSAIPTNVTLSEDLSKNLSTLIWNMSHPGSEGIATDRMHKHLKSWNYRCKLEDVVGICRNFAECFEEFGLQFNCKHSEQDVRFLPLPGFGSVRQLVDEHVNQLLAVCEVCRSPKIIQNWPVCFLVSFPEGPGGITFDDINFNRFASPGQRIEYSCTAILHEDRDEERYTFINNQCSEWYQGWLQVVDNQFRHCSQEELGWLERRAQNTRAIKGQCVAAYERR